ncbi:hypothetical protein HPB52_000932 [Rhipicephalus sanguineus]|uniref:Uncharacterized protein n=1 Tax=Rhipicephalus sanguineus TaxID=34632 RepID=A0A9D4PL19_RHISA|nr:hypothetical protein HPB52_000932 [Rhipicephalus sanguineus]
MIRAELLPYDFHAQMRRELRTQLLDKPLIEYARAMQELHEYADPMALNAERIERIIRQSHPTSIAKHLHSSQCRRLNELFVEAHQMQAAIVASCTYRPPLLPPIVCSPAAPGIDMQAKGEGKPQVARWENPRR